MTEISNSYYSVQMRLTIRALSKNDMGGYKCISKNSIGDAEGNIRLYEMEIPYIIKNTIDAPDLREELGAQGPLREPEDDEDKEEHLVEEADNTASQIRCNLYGIAIVICLL
ncbi:hypothetical protein RUM44_005568 [Polyplax serrata]|uniref:Immunoglobulin I-set domain-containing protein n=1 Tax=Polyplax serrata TaxID=468196 RepID=A0ABR1ADR4_POLSC